MFVITNRDIDEDKKGLDRFGTTPSRFGPNTLRLAEAVKESNGWNIKILPDTLDDDFLKKAKIKRPPDADGNPATAYASRYAAIKVLERVNPGHPVFGKRESTKKGKNLLFFVHGFNNDIKDVLDRAEGFERNFKVEVVVFTWPADGGGMGAASYKSDKRDAKASIGALDRVLLKMTEFLSEFQKDYLKGVVSEASTLYPGNTEKQNRYISRKCDEGCPFKMTMVLHSMGNYLFKNLLKSGVSEGTGLLFDNVVLAAADTNNEGHAEWVDRIRCRNRVYITINENDSALRASRIKAGDEQLARLGHYPYNLNSNRALYIDFTGANHVGSSHAYFEGDPLRNRTVKTFFLNAFSGERAEGLLDYDSKSRMYRIEKKGGNKKRE